MKQNGAIIRHRAIRIKQTLPPEAHLSKPESVRKSSLFVGKRWKVLLMNMLDFLLIKFEILLFYLLSCELLV